MGVFLLCDTQRNVWKSAKIYPITRRFGHQGLVKTKLSQYIVKRAWIKLSISFLSFKIAPLEIKILLPLQEIGRNLVKNKKSLILILNTF